MKPSKVSGGRSFTEALHERYVALDAPEVAPGAIVPDAFVLTASGVQKSIEFVGEQKIRYDSSWCVVIVNHFSIFRKHQQIEMITKITMRSSGISTAGAGLSAIAGHFTDVDLQDNMFHSWTEVRYCNSP